MMIKNFIFLLVVLVFSACVNKEQNINPIKFTDKKEILNKSSIHDAVRINDLSLVKVFIENGADLNKRDNFGYTPLHLGVRFNHYDIVEELINNKVNINTKDRYGDTPLLDSTRNGYTNISKLLICNGAKRKVLDKYEMSPLHYASKTNDVLIAKFLKAKNVERLCKNEKDGFYDLISMYDYNVINDKTPKICGDILDNDVQQVQISFDKGQSVIEAELNDKKWCAQVKDPLDNGTYSVMAMSINSLNQKGLAQDDFTISVLNNLYDILYDEFKSDFNKWNARLVEDTLIFRFKNPDLIFKRGSSEINENYKSILNDFFPRYVNILKNYKSQIANVYIEGHTSSRYRTASTAEMKFEKNKILSQKRADGILNYLQSIKNGVLLENKNYINQTFIPKGKSSSEIILNNDGSENYALSRRVEFRIETK